MNFSNSLAFYLFVKTRRFFLEAIGNFCEIVRRLNTAIHWMVIFSSF